MLSIQNCLLCLVGAVVCLGIAGCGDGVGRVSLNGDIVEDGTPVTLEYGEEMVNVYFFPVDAEGNVERDSVGYGAMADLDGTFIMDGEGGEGIPLGRYRITLENTVTTPRGEEDLWEGRFNLGNTPFDLDVDGSFRNISLDIGAETVSTT